jgi:hypothetical protein
MQAVSTFAVPGEAWTLALHERTGQILLAGRHSESALYVIDGPRDRLLTTIAGPLRGPLAISQTTGCGYASRPGGVAVISMWRPRIVGTIGLDGSAYSVTIGEDRGLVCVGDGNAHGSSVKVLSDPDSCVALGIDRLIPRARVDSAYPRAQAVHLLHELRTLHVPCGVDGAVGRGLPRTQPAFPQ